MRFGAEECLGCTTLVEETQRKGVEFFDARKRIDESPLRVRARAAFQEQEPVVLEQAQRISTMNRLPALRTEQFDTVAESRPTF